MSSFYFHYDSSVTPLGIKGTYLLMRGITNRDDDIEFRRVADAEIGRVLTTLDDAAIECDAELAGFRALHERVGVSNKKNPSSPENLMRKLQRLNRLPHVNLLVDIYNLVCVRTRLALGAHDIAAIAGGVTLRLTTGSEKFVPLGASKAVPVKSGEYSYVDNANDIVCRLEVRQVEKTKITLSSNDIFYIIQGSRDTADDLLRNATQQLVDLTKRYCGGTEEVLYSSIRH